MAANSPIRYVHAHASEIARQNALIRRLVDEALEVLHQPIPDTFLGRKTQEPFAFEESKRSRAPNGRDSD